MELEKIEDILKKKISDRRGIEIDNAIDKIAVLISTDIFRRSGYERMLISPVRRFIYDLLKNENSIMYSENEDIEKSDFDNMVMNLADGLDIGDE